MRLAAAVLAAIAFLPVAPAAAASRPNIIFLLTDDQRWDAMSCMGRSLIETPQMDTLAAGGVLFENNFCTTSICAVSRATFLTGQYARTHGIHGFATGLSDEAFARTYPALLRAAGYRTGFIGKYGVGRELPAEEFDYFRGFPGQGKYFHEINGERVHLTSMIAGQAEEFVRDFSGEAPFCLSVSFKAPHVADGSDDPFQFDPVYADLFAQDEIPAAPKSGAEFFDALPDFLRTSEGRVRWEQRFATPELYQRSVKGYYRLLKGVDDAIGRIRAALAESGEADETIIVFTSDNGFFLGERGLAGKWLMFEESIRTPLIWYDPRLPAHLRGTRRDEMTLSIDIAPSLLEAAGLSIPDGTDGVSLLPLVNDTAASWRTVWLYEHLFAHPRIPKIEGVRTARWKYTRYIDTEPLVEDLYDLARDPGEERNLARDPGSARELERMRRRYENVKSTIPAAPVSQ